MNVRAVVTFEGLQYVARPMERRRVATFAGVVGAPFQPRNEYGEFVSYATLWEAIGSGA